ncbi:MAG: winged helix-turn-helix transcriptional regulator [Spirochaetales bacterium]|nr:winged helix-turn-helix transcriptional regulator [Spirochaetales bacterium]
MNGNNGKAGTESRTGKAGANTAESVKTLVIHEAVVKKVQKGIPREEILYDLADFFKILGDSTRIRILYALNISEMCVWDLSFVIGISRSAVSHQLKILRQANIVKYRKEGKIVFYSLSDEHIKSFLDNGLEHIEES